MRGGGLTLRPADKDWADWLDAAPPAPRETYDAVYLYRGEFDHWWAEMPRIPPTSQADKNIVRSELFAVAHWLSLSSRSGHSFGLMGFLGAALAFIGAGLIADQRVFFSFLFMVMTGVACWSSFNVYRRQRLLKQCLDRIMALLG